MDSSSDPAVYTLDCGHPLLSMAVNRNTAIPKAPDNIAVALIDGDVAIPATSSSPVKDVSTHNAHKIPSAFADARLPLAVPTPNNTILNPDALDKLFGKHVKDFDIPPKPNMWHYSMLPGCNYPIPQVSASNDDARIKVGKKIGEWQGEPNATIADRSDNSMHLTMSPPIFDAGQKKPGLGCSAKAEGVLKPLKDGFIRSKVVEGPRTGPTETSVEKNKAGAECQSSNPSNSNVVFDKSRARAHDKALRGGSEQPNTHDLWGCSGYEYCCPTKNEVEDRDTNGNSTPWESIQNVNTVSGEGRIITVSESPDGPSLVKVRIEHQFSQENDNCAKNLSLKLEETDDEISIKIHETEHRWSNRQGEDTRSEDHTARGREYETNHIKTRIREDSCDAGGRLSDERQSKKARVRAPTSSKGKELRVTYWAAVESGDDTIHIPIDADDVSGTEKQVINTGMKNVWKWAQGKKVRDSITLQDAYDLAEMMHVDFEDVNFGDVDFSDIADVKEVGKAKELWGSDIDDLHPCSAWDSVF